MKQLGLFRIIMICFLLFMWLYNYGMQNYDMAVCTNMQYENLRLSNYLDEIFEPILEKKYNNQQCFKDLLGFAKKNWYCPETTMIFFQFRNQFKQLPNELLCLLFSYAINGISFRPICCNLDVHDTFFSEYFFKREKIVLEDCKIEIIPQILYDYALRFYILNVHLNKPTTNDKELLLHANYIQEKFKKVHNIPDNLPKKFKIELIYNFGQLSDYVLKVKCTKDMFFFFSEQLWIDDFCSAKMNFTFKTPDAIEVYKPNGEIVYISSLGLAKKWDHILEFYVVDVLEKLYVILIHGNKRKRVKIYKVNFIKKENEKAINNLQLIQTILLPYKLEYYTTRIGRVVVSKINNGSKKDVVFQPSSITTKKGSFLFFNSISPIHNYSLMSRKDQFNCDLTLQIYKRNEELYQRNKEREELYQRNKEREELYQRNKEREEYKDAREKYDFSKKLLNYIYVIKQLSLLCLLLHSVWTLYDLHFNYMGSVYDWHYYVKSPFINCTILTLLANVKIERFVRSSQYDIIKKFPQLEH